MDSNSVKQIKKLLTEMFNDHYRKMCDMYNGLEKSISEMIEANNKLINQKLEKLSADIRSNSDSVKLLSQKVRDLEESLTVNQDLIDVRIKSVNEEMKEIKKCVDNNKVKLKEQLRIQEDRSRRNQNQSSKEASDDLAKPRTIIAKLLDYKEKKEIMKRVFKLKDTGFNIRGLFGRNNFNP